VDGSGGASAGGETCGVAAAGGGWDPLLYIDNPLGVPPGRADAAAVGTLDVALGVPAPVPFGDLVVPPADAGICDGAALARGVSAFGVFGGELR
jgi:hypothetical protein